MEASFVEQEEPGDPCCFQDFLQADVIYTFIVEPHMTGAFLISLNYRKMMYPISGEEEEPGDPCCVQALWTPLL